MLSSPYRRFAYGSQLDAVKFGEVRYNQTLLLHKSHSTLQCFQKLGSRHAQNTATHCPGLICDGWQSTETTICRVSSLVFVHGAAGHHPWLPYAYLTSLGTPACQTRDDPSLAGKSLATRMVGLRRSQC